jgi:hypothetical protein
MRHQMFPTILQMRCPPSLCAIMAFGFPPSSRCGAHHRHARSWRLGSPPSSRCGAHRRYARSWRLVSHLGNCSPCSNKALRVHVPPTHHPRRPFQGIQMVTLACKMSTPSAFISPPYFTTIFHRHISQPWTWARLRADHPPSVKIGWAAAGSKG